MSFSLIPLTLQASFIESTMGTAVVNDATATYHNPAALALFNNPQLIVLNSVANFSSQFTGQGRRPIRSCKRTSPLCLAVYLFEYAYSTKI